MNFNHISFTAAVLWLSDEDDDEEEEEDDYLTNLLTVHPIQNINHTV